MAQPGSLELVGEVTLSIVCELVALSTATWFRGVGQLASC